MALGLRSIGRRLLRRIDGWYRRKFALRPLGPVLMVGYEPYQGDPRVFPDGTRLAARQLIGTLHFNNVRLAALRGRTRQRVGLRFARLFRRSLQCLAEQAQSDPVYKNVLVYHGITWFKPHGRAVGFVSETLPDGWRRRWLTAYFRVLAWGFTPLPEQAAAAPQPRRFWITREELIRHFGLRGRAVRARHAAN